MRSAVAGSHGVAARGAAQTLFDAGGRRVLPASVQRAVRALVEGEASRLFTVDAGKRLVGTSGAAGVEGSAVRALAMGSARVAGGQLLRGMTAAAGAGALIDGGWALVRALRGLHGGTMSQKAAMAHVGREAGTGAAATAAGAGAAALLVVLTGGIAAPAVFAVAATASVGAKMGLDAWLNKRHRRTRLHEGNTPLLANP
jgi:hypothetical protein